MENESEGFRAESTSDSIRVSKASGRSYAEEVKNIVGQVRFKEKQMKDTTYEIEMMSIKAHC